MSKENLPTHAANQIAGCTQGHFLLQCCASSVLIPHTRCHPVAPSNMRDVIPLALALVAPSMASSTRASGGESGSSSGASGPENGSFGSFSAAGTESIRPMVLAWSPGHTAPPATTTSGDTVKVADSQATGPSEDMFAVIGALSASGHLKRGTLCSRAAVGNISGAGRVVGASQ